MRYHATLTARDGARYVIEGEPPVVPRVTAASRHCGASARYDAMVDVRERG
jgi:hypothetical protein